MIINFMEDINMKKLLCALLALTSIFCLAACENGKCDECGTEDFVRVYETLDDQELCPACAAKAGWDAMND